MKRETMLKIIKFLMGVLTRVEFEGLENIPAEGGVIFATNHMSRLDIPLLLINPRRTDLTALVADKYQRYWLFKFIVNTGGGVWLDRSKADFGAFREAARILKEGRPLGIAPEGTRSNIGKLLEGKAGTALLAYRTGAPVVPIAITGTESGMRDILLLRRPRLKASFGAPLTIESFERDQREEAMQRYTDEIMCRIAAMMPEKYWGFYANHPRLKELLEAKAG